MTQSQTSATKLAQLIKALVQTAKSNRAKVFVEIEGEAMPLLRSSIGDGGVNIHYGIPGDEYYETTLTRVIRHGSDHLRARDLDGEVVVLKTFPVK